jgi:hypothetical protein
MQQRAEIPRDWVIQIGVPVLYTLQHSCRGECRRHQVGMESRGRVGRNRGRGVRQTSVVAKHRVAGGRNDVLQSRRATLAINALSRCRVAWSGAEALALGIDSIQWVINPSRRCHIRLTLHE